MGSKSIDRDIYIRRAHGRCEHCLTPEQYLSYGLHIDHVIALQHGGTDEAENLAAACCRCSALKGPNIASIDPFTGAISPLFHPRRQVRHEHFKIIRARIRGKSPYGRATAALLDFNSDIQVEIRRILLAMDALAEPG